MGDHSVAMTDLGYDDALVASLLGEGIAFDGGPEQD
jgi:hypothetical protein